MKKLYRIVFPYSFHVRMINAKRQFQKLAELWKVTPADCRGQLLTEFVLRPVDFERCFAQEIDFQWNTIMRWK